MERVSGPVTDLLDLLDLEPIEVNIFRGRSPDEDRQRVFGGQVMGQALVAAQRTVDDDRQAHSLHSYFLRPGDPTVPILYEVDRIRDGRSFATRRVVAIQHGRAIFTMSVSFHIQESSQEYHLSMPQVDGPEDLVDWTDYLATIQREIPEDMAHWFRAAAPVPDDQALQQALLTYAVDMWLLDCSTMAHGYQFSDPDMQMASLDHSMWFLRPFRADEWLLLDAECITTAGARGMNRANIYTVDGRLVATANQEGLMRRHDG